MYVNILPTLNLDEGGLYMKRKTYLIVVSLLILNLVSVPSAKAGEINGVEEPPSDLGFLPVTGEVTWFK